jgi:NADH dehydrogenase FAD-containing subunit
MSESGPHILIVGGGYVGMYTALRLQRKLKPGEGRITVVEPNSYMTYQPRPRPAVSSHATSSCRCGECWAGATC